ncbi:MAG: aldo/keto reductase [Clostridiales bacterium]|jgi:diketogulonate reductase-like aldo/keto reductase|nr:aldo/keto reductase [Clostridiales bacterium]
MAMPNGLQDVYVLNNDVRMPVVGLGVWKAGSGPETRQAVRWALEIGYRSIDTAFIYQNEADVGAAISEGPIPRDRVFVATKLWHSDQGYDGTLRAFQAALGRMGLSYLDLYLIHHPLPPKMKDTWRAMESLYQNGLARAIGVSNFLPHHIDELLADAKIKPAVNQIERHPYLQQRDAMRHNGRHGILTEAWAPLAKGSALSEPCIAGMAERRKKTPAQIVLRWGLQSGAALIPKSVRRERLEENAGIFDFSLTDAEMAAIDALEANRRFGGHPDDTSWMK